ncbi:MAG: TRAP transporter small permease [Spirochaetaceae bacterium]|jgi:TRAP-type C4-dicarboxylate transport system permease small subunit|nr:TRAP transporter small permease [Spirochaetaceae bacterium]
MMGKIIAALQRLQIMVGALCLTLFLVTVLIQIFARYLEIPVTWTEDVSLYSFIWAVFMGAGAMVFEGKHFAFTSLQDNLKSPLHKRVLSVAISVCILFFALLMLYYGTLITRQFWNYRWVTIPAFKRGPVWLCLPVAGGTMALYALYRIVREVRNLAMLNKSDESGTSNGDGTFNKEGA